MSRTVLVPHGVSPTKVGVVLDAGVIKLISPCCGTLFYEGSGPSKLNKSWTLSAFCGNCKLEWTELMFTSDSVLYHHAKVETIRGQRGWLARSLGVPFDQLEVTVE